jgi:YaiO family outer membrane protein
LSIAQRRAAGSIIGRLNLANRYATTGAQYEIDAYPRLGAHAYGYFNAGYSPATIFPEWRFGGEYFRTLPHAYEASLGFRHLRFTGTPVTLFTGTLGRYTGNYWFSLRPYIHDREPGVSASASLTARRYYADADNYVGGRIGAGTSPSEDITADQLGRTSSATVGVHGSRSTSQRTIGTWSLTFEREKLTLQRTRNRWAVRRSVDRLADESCNDALDGVRVVAPPREMRK